MEGGEEKALIMRQWQGTTTTRKVAVSKPSKSMPAAKPKGKDWRWSREEEKRSRAKSTDRPLSLLLLSSSHGTANLEENLPKQICYKTGK